MREEFASLPFSDGVRAGECIERLERRLAQSLLLPLASLLAQSPDPEGALRQLDRYVEAAPAELLEDLARHAAALIYLIAIFGHSDSLTAAVLEDPSLVTQFARDRHLAKLKSNDDLMQDYARYSVTSPDLWVSAQLARFKRRNVLRVALKDVLGLSSLGETSLELATLADVILTHSLAYCGQELEKRYGIPQYRDRQGRIARSGFSIMSLGRLGGNELNYSPVIDLIFLYARDGETSGGSEPASAISNKEYYLRLADAVNRTITQCTPHGEVYKTDLSKRPEGEQGGLAISVNSAHEYFEHRARSWELRMLIKARHSAGDPRVTREFLRGVEAYVYSAGGNGRSSGPGLEAVEESNLEVADSVAAGLDVNTHPGGLCDIESAAQMLQQIHGANDFWVRSGGTLLALRKLHDKGHLTDSDFAGLTSAYEFLRRVEHRIQMEAGPYLHRLPEESAALDRLARRVNAEWSSLTDSGSALVDRIKKTFLSVQEISHRLAHVPYAAPHTAEFALSAAVGWPQSRGEDHFDVALRSLGAFAPEAVAVAQEAQFGIRARKDTARLIAAILNSSERLRALRQNPQSLQRALELIAASPHFASMLIQHPDELAIFTSAPPNFAPSSSDQLGLGLNSPPAESIAVADGADLSAVSEHQLVGPFQWSNDTRLTLAEKMALLRAEYRKQSIALAAGDCVHPGLIKTTLARWNGLAVQCVRSAFEIASSSLRRNLDSDFSGICLLSLGRLSRREFDLGASAKFVFVTRKLPGKPSANFYSHWIGRFVDVLSIYTRDGNVIPVEVALWPKASPFVTEDFLMDHLNADLTWAQAIVFADAGAIAGDHEFGLKLMEAANSVLSDRLDSSASFAEVQHAYLIEPFEKERPAPTPGFPIECALNRIGSVIAALRLRGHLPHKPGMNTCERISDLRRGSLVSRQDAQALICEVEFLLAADHAIRLVSGSEEGGVSEEVENLARRWGIIRSDETLAVLLPAALQRAHELCSKLAGHPASAGATGSS